MKAFLQGEQWFRQAAWDSSLAAFERAVALDSTFCVAHWRLALVAGWQRVGFDSLSRTLALRAGELNHGLAPRDSLLVTFDSIFSSGLEGRTRYDRLVSTARQAISRYPTDVDAWNSLGEAYTHFGLNYGVGARQALAALDQAIALDSAYAPPYIHAIELDAGLEGLEGARRYATEYLRRAPGDVTAQGIRLALAVADPERRSLPETRHALRTASANVLLKSWLPVMRAPDSAEAALELGRYFAASPEGSAPWLPASFKQAALVFTLMYRGHLREATRQWSPGIWEADGAQVTLALLGASQPDSADQAFHRWLAAGDVTRGTRALAWWGHRRDTLALRRMQRLGDSLARSSPAGLQRELATYAAPAAEAYLVLARGDTAGALRRFETLPDSLCGRCLLDVLTKVSLLAAKSEDAAVRAITDRWRAVQPTTTVGLLALAGARAAERLHDRNGAARRYQFVADLWRHADPELQPYVDEARAALRRLGEEST
jgi:tetratricopeptide (TPR) repeat protein